MKLAHLPLAAFTVDATGAVVHWNKACENVTGYTGTQVRGQSVRKILEFETTDHALPLRSREPQLWAARMIHADGRRTPVRVGISADSREVQPTFTLVVMPVPLLSDSPIHDLPIGKVIEELPGIFYVVDEDSHLLLWNRQLEQALEMNREEMAFDRGAELLRSGRMAP